MDYINDLAWTVTLAEAGIAGVHVLGGGLLTLDGVKQWVGIKMVLKTLPSYANQ